MSTTISQGTATTISQATTTLTRVATTSTSKGTIEQDTTSSSSSTATTIMNPQGMEPTIVNPMDIESTIKLQSKSKQPKHQTMRRSSTPVDKRTETITKPQVVSRTSSISSPTAGAGVGVPLSSCSSPIYVSTVINYIHQQMKYHPQYECSYNSTISSSLSTSSISTRSVSSQHYSFRSLSSNDVVIPKQFQLKPAMMNTNFHDALLMKLKIERSEIQSRRMDQVEQYILNSNDISHNNNSNNAASPSKNNATSTRSENFEDRICDNNSQQCSPPRTPKNNQMNTESRTTSNPIIQPAPVTEDGYIRGRKLFDNLHKTKRNNNKLDDTKQETLQQSTNNDTDDKEEVIGSICIVIRRPACSFCQKQVLELCLLQLLYPDALRGFNTIWGIIKDIEDPDGILHLVSNYFYNFQTSKTTTTTTDGTETTTSTTTTAPICYPLYCDKSYTFYHALGDRKIGLNQLLRSPNTLLRGVLCELWQTVTRSGPTQQQQQQPSSASSYGGMKGDGFTQGGIIVFDAQTNEPILAYEEEAGADLPIAEFVRALDTIRYQRWIQKQQQMQQTTTKSSQTTTTTNNTNS